MPVPRTETSCISLVGLPGTPLAAVAEDLGRRLDLPVFEAERLIEAWYGCPLSMILDKLACEALPAELDTVLGHISVQRAIVAVGSEALELPAARQRLRLLGPVVGLTVVSPEGSEALSATAGALLNDRDLAEVLALHRELLGRWTDTVVRADAEPEVLAARIEEWLNS